MPPQDADKLAGEALARLRQYVERPALAAAKTRQGGPAENELHARQSKQYDDEDDGPITTRWATG